MDKRWCVHAARRALEARHDVDRFPSTANTSPSTLQITYVSIVRLTWAIEPGGNSATRPAHTLTIK